MEETQQEVLQDLWSKYYPDCSLEIQADSIGTLATKIRSDESTDADVVIGGLFAADGDSYHDILQPYTAACDEEQDYHDAAGYYTFYDVQVMCLAVNPELRDELGIRIEAMKISFSRNWKARSLSQHRMLLPLDIVSCRLYWQQWVTALTMRKAGITLKS